MPYSEGSKIEKPPSFPKASKSAENSSQSAEKTAVQQIEPKDEPEALDEEEISSEANELEDEELEEGQSAPYSLQRWLSEPSDFPLAQTALSLNSTTGGNEANTPINMENHVEYDFFHLPGGEIYPYPVYLDVDEE